MSVIRTRAIEHFQGGYLSLISIIQGTALAFLVSTVLDDDYFCSLQWHQWWLYALTLILIILTWHEYWIGTTAMPFVPSLFDSVYPFAVGVLEFFIVKSVGWTDKPGAWFFFMGAFFICAYFGFWNMYSRAANVKENINVLERLGRLSQITKYGVVGIGALFIAFGFLVHDYLVLCLAGSLILLVAFGIRSHIYWNRILDE